VNTLSTRTIVSLVASAIWIFAAPVESAETNRVYSNASLTGTFVFRVSGNSLFTQSSDLTSSPVFLASLGLVTFDGMGLLKGAVENSATRTDVIVPGKSGRPQSSQILCDLKMTGTYSIEPDGIGTMTISFTPSGPGANCGASTGLFNIVLVSPTQVELVSSGQLMADPAMGQFNSYVVQGELIRRQDTERSRRR
jgi:hypothetical protein